MHLLVTGASGFLGAHLVRQLLAAEHTVRTTHRPGDDCRLLRDLPTEVLPCDCLDAAGTRRALAGVEAVFHVAALVSFQPALYQRQMQVNVEGTRLLLTAARAAGVRRLIYTSTVNTLGAPPSGMVGDEDTPNDWQRYRLGYMDSKRAAEALVLAANGRDLETLAVLPGTMFGPGDLNVNAGTYIRLGARGVLLAAPPGGTSVVHVEDVARGHLLALARGRPGARYILGGENLSYRELFTLIAGELGRPPPRLTLPASLLHGPGRAADWLRDRLGLALPLQEGLARAACSRLHYSSERAGRELGYHFRPAREAVADAVAWYRNHGLIPPAG